MKLILRLATLVMVFGACSSAKKQDSARDSTIVSSPSAALLTDEQKSQGWKLLFDGQTLNGWRIYQNKDNNSWEVKDGTLHSKPSEDRAANKRSDLVTNDEYENFELSLEWKISAKGNSGIIYRVSEGLDQPYLSGPEYQLLDDIGYPEKIEDWQKSGANYAMNPPVGLVLKPAGEWNTTKIIANGNHVEHWLNGVKVVEYELGSEDWKKRKSEGKWKDAKDYGSFKKGRIDIQDHGSEAWFRNIMIKVL